MYEDFHLACDFGVGCHWLYLLGYVQFGYEVVG